MSWDADQKPFTESVHQKCQLAAVHHNPFPGNALPQHIRPFQRIVHQKQKAAAIPAEPVHIQTVTRTCRISLINLDDGHPAHFQLQVQLFHGKGLDLTVHPRQSQRTLGLLQRPPAGSIRQPWLRRQEDSLHFHTLTHPSGSHSLPLPAG